MAVSGTLGSNLQGVSQQPQHIRNDGQVTEQINMISDVVEGLTSRPATELSGFNTGATADMRFLNNSIQGDDFQIGYKAGVLEVLNSAGVSMTVTPDTDTLDYIGTDMTSYTFDDVVYLVNRDLTVAADASTTAGEALVAVDHGIVTVDGGLVGRTYTLKLTYSDGDVAEGAYQPGTGDIANADAENITLQLFSRIQLHADWKVATDIEHDNATIHISGITDFTLTATDASGDTTIRAAVNEIKDITDLPRYTVHGALLQVVGSDGSEDDFWMRYEIDGETVGSGFGAEGAWVEWFNPFETHQIDTATMPHILTRTGPTAFSLSEATWQDRRVGDEDTNPLPGFIGESIRAISGFQSRLVFISGSRVSMSRTDIPTDFFIQSAVTGLDTDPIDILSTAEDEFQLQWMLPFDRDLVIFGDATQFLIKGSTELTPDNVSLVQTTSFDMGDGAKPVSTGRTVLFPFENGSFAGVKEFFSANSVDANSAVSITQVQDKYMPGKISNMVSSTNFSTVLVQTDDADETASVFVHQYLWDGEEKVQAAWYKWTFPYDVKNLYFSGPSVNVLMYDSVLGYIQTELNLDIPEHADTGYPVTLDIRDDYITALSSLAYVLSDYVAVDYTADPVEDAEKTFIDLPWPDAKLVQGLGCTVPGQVIQSVVISALGDGTFRYVIPATTAPESATVIAGLVYPVSVKPTMPFIRDSNGRVVRNSKLVVTEFIVAFESSGIMTATMASKYRAEDIVFSNERIAVDNDPDDPLGIGIRSGDFIVPWGERSDYSELELSTTDARPMTVTDIEWQGQMLIRGRRV